MVEDLSHFNPYQPPAASISALPLASEPEEGRGVWREEMTLVMAKDAILPRRCVKCNAAATFLHKRSMSRLHPTLFVLLLLPGIGPFVLIIVMVVILRTSKYAMIPLCDRDRARRSRNLLIAWVVALAGLALLFAPAVYQRDLAFLQWFGLGLIVLGLLYGIARSQVLTLQKSTRTHAWLDKAAPGYLDALPRLPTPEGPTDFDF